MITLPVVREFPHRAQRPCKACWKACFKVLSHQPSEFCPPWAESVQQSFISPMKLLGIGGRKLLEGYTESHRKSNGENSSVPSCPVPSLTRFWLPNWSRTEGRRLAVVHSLSCVRLFVTPRIAACQASLSFTNFWNLFKLMSIESKMPFNHLILFCPLVLQPSIFPSNRVFSSELALHIRWPR